MGGFYGDLSLPYVPRSCQNVEVSGLQVEVVSCSAHFVSGKKKKHEFLSHDSQESGYARPVTIIVIQLELLMSQNQVLGCCIKL